MLRTLDLRVRRRISGLLPGDVRSAMLGPGTELAQLRPYQPGDDVRAIDWNVTARTGEPHVRLHVAERAFTTWVVLDVSASMWFGTQERAKVDVAEGLVLAIAHLATAGANRLGGIVFDGARARVAMPPTSDRRALPRFLGQAREASAGQPASIGTAMELADRVCRRAGAVVVVSDLRGRDDWADPLTRLAFRHHVLVVEVRDEREQRLADAGELVLVDPETGRRLRVDTGDDGLRRRFAAAADAERERVRRRVLAAGADHLVTTTTGDWLRPLAMFLSKRRRTGS